MFGAVYLWSGILVTSCVLLFWSFSPRYADTTRPLRVIDMSFVVVGGAVLLQMVPLPVPVVQLLSPARATFVRASSLTPLNPGFSPLTLSVADTAHAAVTLLSIAVTFWLARSIFSKGGIRTFTVIIGWGAIVLSIVAFAQHASGTPLVYGFWHPRDQGARPLGPFINRNHFGTWAVMAVCLCIGYLQWRQQRTSDGTNWRSRLAGWMDGRGMLLQLAIVLLAAVIALGASRSALVALAAAAGYVAVAVAVGRDGRRRYLPVVLAGVLAVGGMLTYGDAQRLLLRIDETRETGIASRMAIWRDAVPVMRDFAVTGVGAGAFGDAMRVYQTTPRTYYHNEAHNQYVQLLAEGGALLTIPVVVGLAAFIAAARERLRHRNDRLYWMRVACAGALVGVAIQSIWETGLTLPANGMFAAALAGLLVHEPANAAGPGQHSQEHN